MRWHENDRLPVPDFIVVWPEPVFTAALLRMGGVPWHKGSLKMPPDTFVKHPAVSRFNHLICVNGMYFDGAALPGEDRSWSRDKKGRVVLGFDMIPSSCWFTNVRTAVADSQWNTLKSVMHARCGYRCECCERKAGEGRSFLRDAPIQLELHENWSFEFGKDQNNIQRLNCLWTLCDSCHACIHMGRTARVMGNPIKAFEHMADLRGVSVKTLMAEYAEARAEVAKMNQFAWSLDLSPLKSANVRVLAPPGQEENISQKFGQDQRFKAREASRKRWGNTPTP